MTLTVYPVNDAPMANAQSVSTDDFTPLAITLTGSDVETGSASLTFAIIDAPMNGTLSGTPPNVAYTPNFNYERARLLHVHGDRPPRSRQLRRAEPDLRRRKRRSPKTTVSITVTDGRPPQMITD